MYKSANFLTWFLHLYHFNVFNFLKIIYLPLCSITRLLSAMPDFQNSRCRHLWPHASGKFIYSVCTSLIYKIQLQNMRVQYVNA